MSNMLLSSVTVKIFFSLVCFLIVFRSSSASLQCYVCSLREDPRCTNSSITHNADLLKECKHPNDYACIIQFTSAKVGGTPGVLRICGSRVDKQACEYNFLGCKYCQDDGCNGGKLIHEENPKELKAGTS